MFRAVMAGSGPDKTQRSGGNRTTALVLSGIFAISIVMGLVSYRQFMSSETRIQSDFGEIRERGASLGVEGCVDAVLEWHSRCDAMKVLCDKSVGRMMEQCLDGGDRTAYCAQVDLSTNANSGFGYHECKERGAHATRAMKKVCGTTYRAIAYHCQALQAEQGGSEPSAPEQAGTSNTPASAAPGGNG